MALVEPVNVARPEAVGPVHFIAIGGAGMSGIALLFHELGVAVSGSDQEDSATLQALAAAGITTFVGHDAGQLGDARTVVVSSAVRSTNVELREARRRGLRVWHRSAALASLLLGHDTVSVAGTAGKTTTTGMTAVMLAAAGADPSYVIGAPLAGSGRSAHLGTGGAFVVEADESDGSFLQYPTRIAVVTNVEADHLDTWETPQRYAEAFVRFCTAEAVDTVVLSADDPGTRALARELAGGEQRVVSFGEDEQADVRLTDLVLDGTRTTATLTAPDDEGEFTLRVPGRYNLHNAAAAYAVGRALGLDGPLLRGAAATFTGMHRRFELVGEARGIRVFDDYAHHPTKVRAALAAARQVAGKGRVIVCFQPHLYSRTRDFADEFGRALALADEVVILDVYAAREDPLPGVTGELIALRVPAPARVRYVPIRDDVSLVVASLARPGDLVLTAGAGDVTTLAPLIVDALRHRGTEPGEQG